MTKVRASCAQPSKKAVSVQPYHHGDLRPSLIESACQVLREKGIGALSLREVARRSGVSQAAPYRHFPDKASLLAAVATEGFRSLTTAMSSAAAGCLEPPERFRALGREYVIFALKNPSMLRLMFGAEIADKSDYPQLQRAASEAYGLLSDTAASVTDTTPAGTPNTLALAAWSLVHGLSHLLIDGQVSAGKAGEIDAFVDQVLGKLRP